MNEWAAIYDGPEGAISVRFRANDVKDACIVIARSARMWRDTGRDDLRLHVCMTSDEMRTTAACRGFAPMRVTTRGFELCLANDRVNRSDS